MWCGHEYGGLVYRPIAVGGHAAEFSRLAVGSDMAGDSDMAGRLDFSVEGYWLLDKKGLFSHLCTVFLFLGVSPGFSLSVSSFLYVEDRRAPL